MFLKMINWVLLQKSLLISPLLMNRQKNSLSRSRSFDKKITTSNWFLPILYKVCDITMLHALNVLASAQGEPTQKTRDVMIQFLSQCTNHPNAAIRFYASDMILKIHSDESYLSEYKERNRVGAQRLKNCCILSLKGECAIFHLESNGTLLVESYRTHRVAQRGF